jgi:ABC-type multidrug transport system fused ATPase/permease subunit
MRELYAKLFDLLEAREKRRFLVLLAMILGMGLFEAAGVGSILPFLGVLANPELVETNRWLAAAYAAGGFASRQEFLFALGMGVFCVVVFGLLFKTATLYAITRFSQMRAYSLSTRMLAGYLGQPYAWFLDRHSADLGKTVLGEVSQVVNGVMLPALRLIAYAVVALFLVALVVAVDPAIALTAAAVIGAVYGLLYVAARRLLTRIGAARIEANRARFQIVQEATGGIKEVKVLGLEHVLAQRFRGPARRMAQCLTLTGLIGEAPRHVLEAVLFGGMLLLVLYMMQTRPGGLGEVLPLLGLYALAGARLFPAMQQIYQNLTRLRFTKPALDALHHDLCEIAASGEALQGPPPAPLGLSDRLELRGVHYAYPGSRGGALDGLDLEVRAQTTVGLVGGTGAGKTTAVDVILGLLQPQQGRLVVDGVPVAGRERLRAWQRSIGYVPQSIFLADDTVAGNIAFGIPDDAVDMAAVERAARIAELHRFVTEELPAGYATLVGERGVRLSGGQRQRIGLARALYHDPDVLVLDEATSALDTLTERAVMEAVHALGHAKTVIMIAHRLSTVRACDEIVLMDKGRAVARGSYDRLLAESPVFRRMAGAGA